MATVTKKVVKKTTKKKVEREVTNKLPAKFKAAWIEALTNGEYRQCSGRLMDAEGAYCCLGVAASICEIGKEHIQKHYMLTKKEGPHAKTKDCKTWNKLRQRIPKNLRDNKPLQDKLSGMNDQGKSFNQIAKYIDKNC